MDKKHIVSLSGKEYPLYSGILAEAHERGLQGIETELIQIPTQANDYTAIVKATVRMKDGSQFEDFGDANPKNTNARIATALLRMASTRAKGRALRDAINVGQTMLEELPDLDGDHDTPPRGRPAPAPRREEVPPPRSGMRHEMKSQTGQMAQTWVDPESGKSFQRQHLILGVGRQERRMEEVGLQLLVHPPLEQMENESLVRLGRRIAELVKEAEQFSSDLGMEVEEPPPPPVKTALQVGA